MPAPRRSVYDSEEFRRRYHSGETLASIAAWIGVTDAAVLKAASRRGYPGKFMVRYMEGVTNE